jgi:hypothetical protein
MKDVEKIVDRYVSKKAPSLQQPISHNGRESTFHPKTEPLEKSANLIAARSLSGKQVAFLQKSSFQVKVCWSLHDKKKLYDLISRLERDNDILWNMTQPNLLISMCDAVSSKMSFADLKTFAVRTSSKIDSQEAAQKEEYERRVKEQGQARTYVAGLDRESKEQKLSRRIDLSCFQEMRNAKLPDQRTRTPSTYLLDGKEMEVLIEWKEWDENIISRDEVIARVSDIVAILKSPPSSLSKILPSVGFLEDSRSNSRRTKWMGIVYDISAFGNHYKIRTLRDLLTQPKETGRGMWKPALGDKFRLAYGLASTLLAVHNCGWLHKGLRPENIVFFSSSESIKQPYLLGWDCSRSAKRGQSTEPVIAWHADAELYQHPQYFEERADCEDSKSRYRIEFDHYQLGCLLLEIGLWCLIGDLKRWTAEQFVGPDWRNHWKKYLENKAAKLEQEMGKMYSDVVLYLLKGLEEAEIEYWNGVVLRLDQCRA